MKNVLVTGARGFVGRNLCSVLRRMETVALSEIDVDNSGADLEQALQAADVVYHLAGVNRPKDDAEFQTGNAGSTEQVCDLLRAKGRSPKVVLTSSIQADQDNPYGRSKREAEEALARFAAGTGAECVVYRLKNLFGKWCPYIDDVAAAFVSELDPAQPGFRFAQPLPAATVALGELAEKIQGYHDSRRSLELPDFSDPFHRSLYATYLSYLPPDDFGYDLDIRSDERGSLAEFIKSPFMGQIFISHPPGYTHAIENVGEGDLVTLFWASEMLDRDRPDTHFKRVIES